MMMMTVEPVFLVYMTFPRPYGRQDDIRHYIDSFQTRVFRRRSDAVDYQTQMNNAKLQGKFEIEEIELR